MRFSFSLHGWELRWQLSICSHARELPLPKQNQHAFALKFDSGMAVTVPCTHIWLENKTYISCFVFLSYLHKIFHLLYPLWGGMNLQLPSFPTPQSPMSPGKHFHTDPRGTAIGLTKDVTRHSLWMQPTVMMFLLAAWHRMKPRSKWSVDGQVHALRWQFPKAASEPLKKLPQSTLQQLHSEAMPQNVPAGGVRFQSSHL